MSPATSRRQPPPTAAELAEVPRQVLARFQERTGIPSLAPTRRDDADAAIAIALCDCFGNAELALTAVDELIDRMSIALPERGLFELWIHFLAWIDSGGGRVRELDANGRRRYREVVRLQVATAANEAAARQERAS